MKHVTTISTLLKSHEFSDDFPIVIRVRKFDESAAKEFSEKMAKAHNTGQPVVPVVIDSYGGQVYSLLAMVSEIQHSRLPVATIVQGKAMSCGAILFSFGQKGMRYMDPHATVMIHDVSGAGWGKVEEVKADAKECERLNKKLYYMMAENCGKNKTYFLKMIHERGHADWFLDADDCLEHGLANHLTVPQFTVDVNVDVKFE